MQKPSHATERNLLPHMQTECAAVYNGFQFSESKIEVSAGQRASQLNKYQFLVKSIVVKNDCDLTTWDNFNKRTRHNTTATYIWV